MVELASKSPAWDDGIEVLSGHPSWIALRVKCRTMTADRLVQFVKEMEVGLPEQERENIGTAFREMLPNAIEHGGKFDPEQMVEITCIRTERLIF